MRHSKMSERADNKTRLIEHIEEVSMIAVYEHQHSLGKSNFRTLHFLNYNPTPKLIPNSPPHLHRKTPRRTNSPTIHRPCLTSSHPTRLLLCSPKRMDDLNATPRHCPNQPPTRCRRPPHLHRQQPPLSRRMAA